nr:ARID DNA-binding domain-containing protein [Tanacetum cinerariifolium]
LVYMFNDPKGQSFNEDRLRFMHNKYLEEYFKALDGSAEQNKTLGLISMQDDVIEIKGTLYSTKVTTFNEYVAFLNLVKQDEIISQEWDTFRGSAPNLEVASKKGKEKLEHFGVKLEEEKEYHDTKIFHPMQPNKRSIQYNDIKIKKEATSSTSSEDLVIV